jgi:hypothetical protein
MIPLVNTRHLTLSWQEDTMTRQCAWCATYLDFVQSETCVTHGICESCVERIRNATLEQLAPPSDAVRIGDGQARVDLGRPVLGL